MPRDEERFTEYAISDWLYRKRRSLGFGLKDVAAAINVSTVTVHLWEMGLRSPGTYARRKAWARALNCRMEITLVNTNGKRHSF